MQADAAMDMAERDFCQASLEYVFQLQAVQERKKFELVETLLGFVFGWWTFHHTAQWRLYGKLTKSAVSATPPCFHHGVCRAVSRVHSSVST